MPSSQENVSAMRRLPDNNLSPDFELPLLVPQIHRCITSIVNRRARGQHSETSEASGGEHGVLDSRRSTMETRSHLGQKTKKHNTATTEGASHRGQLRCGRSGRHAAITRSPLDTLGTKTKAGRILQNAIYGKRIWADSQS